MAELEDTLIVGLERVILHITRAEELLGDEIPVEVDRKLALAKDRLEELIESLE